MPIPYVLTSNEQEAFDNPPSLSAEMRTICFSIDNELDKELNNLRTPSTKVGFLLQYGYFKASRRFFFVNRFQSEDIEYAVKALGFSKDDIDLSSYKKRMPVEHQKRILALFNCKPFSDEIYVWLDAFSGHATILINLSKLDGALQLIAKLITNSMGVQDFFLSPNRRNF